MFSILYCASTILCIVSILSIAKTSTKLLWLPVAIMLQVGSLAVVFGILALAKIGYTIPLATAINLVLSAALLLFNHHSTGTAPGNEAADRPRSKSIRAIIARIASIDDIVCYLTVIVVAVIWSLLQFGPLLEISFLTSDAAIHCNSAYQIYAGNPVTGQYFTYLFTVSLMSMWPIPIPQELCYIPFIYGEILSFMVSGLAFYACLRMWCTDMGMPAQAIIIALYMMGFPLSGFLSGYSYLCMSITVIASILFLCHAVNWTQASFLPKCALSVLLFALATSYLLFVPPLFFSVMIFLIVQGKKQAEAVGRIVLELFAVFLVPAIVGIGISCAGFGLLDNSAPALHAIQREAGASKILYSSFVFIAPLFIYGFIVRMKHRAFSILEYTAIVFVSYTVLLLALGMLHKINAYYYYKQYHVLWLLFFLYTAFAVQTLRRKQPALLCSYCITWLSIICLLFTGADQMLSEKRPRFNQAPASYEFLPVYADNILKVGTERYTQDALELMERANELRSDDSQVDMLMSDNLMRWDHTLYGGNDLVWWGYTDEELLEELRKYDYIAVNGFNPHLVNADGHTFIEVISGSDLLGEEVYANESGAIYEVQHQ